jgi:hypothetical protein
MTNSTIITGKHHRTLEAIFHHPVAHNLDWSDVVGLIGHIGVAAEGAHNDFVFKAGGQRMLIRKPHTKDLTGPEVTDLRHFLDRAGFAPVRTAPPQVRYVAPVPSLLIVVDHHGARIFHVDVSAANEAAHTIKPYDPHHFLHHLSHKDQSRERGQRAPEEVAYYESIAAAVAVGGKIVVIGHGSGKSDAADHLTAYLKARHKEIYARVVTELKTDLSAITEPQLLDLAGQALRR